MPEAGAPSHAGRAPGLASVVSFLALAFGVGDYGAAVGRIVLADMVALACLVAAALLKWRRPGPEVDVG